MPEQLIRILQPIKTRWDALTRDQKIKLAAVVGVILLALILTVYLTTRTTYYRFLTLEDGNDVISVEQTLKNANIKTRRGRDGYSIEVDKKRVMDAKIELDANPTTSKIPFTYQDALSLSGMSTTDTQNREMTLRVLQSELRQYLIMTHGVDDAEVRLVIPDRRAFLAPETNPSSAAVTLKVNRDFPANGGETIALHVSRSVEGLLLENVEVTGQYLNVLFSGSRSTEEETAATIATLQQQERRALIFEIRSLFYPNFDEVNVVPNLMYDTLIEETEYTFRIATPDPDSDIGVPLDLKEESSKVDGMNPGDEPGLGSNDYQSPDYQTGSGAGGSASSRLREMSEIGYNTDENQKKYGPGSYIRDESSITISLVRYKTYSQAAFMRQDRTRTQTDWDDFKFEMGGSRLVEAPELELYKQMGVASTGMRLDNVFITVSELPFFLDDVSPSINWQQIVMIAIASLLILMLALGLIRRKQEEEAEEEPEPELSVEDLLVSTQLEEAREEAEKLEEINYYKESEIKKQIEKFVNEKPEAVAALLRNWINNEEW
ncbi:MAG: hypothetical protein FWF03_00095 [Defluviitaleaceae bacterium]|nr:hypothetical protein [Defluviitaleaceae bacterium]